MPNFSDQYVRQLEQRLKQMETRSVGVRGSRRQERLPALEKTVRIARTVANDFPYPDGDSWKYEVELGKPEFDDSTIGGSVTFTPYVGGDNYRIAGLLTQQTITEGTLVHLMHCHGQWYIINTVMLQVVEFMINDPYLSEPYGDTGDSRCDERENDAPTSVQAEITRRPCGMDLVAGESSGFITVHDGPGNYLKEREQEDLNGKTGLAVYLSADDAYGGCRWVIFDMDWFRWVQVVEDVIDTGDCIDIYYRNVKVWDDCGLDKYCIETTDC